MLDLGLDRLVIGTLAISQPDWFRLMCRKFPGRLVLGIDAREGRVACEGWLETSEVAAAELARQFAGEPLAAVIYTDIATDGMLAGPNLAAHGRDAGGGRRAGGRLRRRDDAKRTWPGWRPRAWPAALSAGRCTKEP